MLRLLGVISGGGTRALIEGFPGSDGARFVTAGQVVGDVRIVAIGPRTVRLAQPDTSWTLSLDRRH